MPDSFEKDLMGEFDRVISNVEKGIADSVKQGLERAIRFAPVATGYLASNFRIGVNTDDVPLDPPTRPKPGTVSLSPDISGEAAKLQGFKAGDDIVIGNATPYARFIDEGTSRIPAANIMVRTAAFISSLIERKFK